jgi:phosphatidyl-myo-inositol dimannoside synthase
MRRPGIRMVAVSSFTAGALASCGPSNVLLPGLSRPWFETLTGTSTAASDGNGYRIVTAFRLSQWQDKGLPELMQAVSVLERSDVSVIVCGTGAAPVSLEEFSNKYPGCVIRPGLSDCALARELAAADLFVLATRSRRGRHPSGEGFGLVLLEAQLAGTPVVGPAFGGSHDAYLEGVTGATPVNEGAAALAAVLEELLGDPEGLKRMGTQAGEWARTCFAPELYASRAAAILL